MNTKPVLHFKRDQTTRCFFYQWLEKPMYEVLKEWDEPMPETTNVGKFPITFIQLNEETIECTFDAPPRRINGESSGHREIKILKKGESCRFEEAFGGDTTNGWPNATGEYSLTISWLE